MAFIPMTIGSGKGSIADIIKNEVINGGHTTICTLSPYNNRVTLNSGGCVADKTNKVVYVYADFTLNQNISSPSDFAQIFTLEAVTGETVGNYFPHFMSSSRANPISLLTDVTSDNNNISFGWGYFSSSYPRRLIMNYGQSVSQNERYIVCGVYTYT